MRTPFSTTRPSFENGKLTATKAKPLLALLAAVGLMATLIPSGFSQASSALGRILTSGAQSVASMGGAKTEAGDALAKLPLYFEQNQGQTASEAKFMARAGDSRLFITPTGTALRFKGDALFMDLVGGNPGADVKGIAKTSTKSNYFTGSDPANWHAGIPNFSSVKASSVYPGIDVVYYGNQGKVEYDFVVAPGADPSPIAMRFEGAESMKIDKKGNLVFEMAQGNLIQKRPYVYQRVNGKRAPVSGSYALSGSEGVAEVGFRLGAYDHSRALVIDPLIYSTLVGGVSSSDYARSIAVDSTGNTYATGGTESYNFPTKGSLPCNTTFGRFPTSSAQCDDSDFDDTDFTDGAFVYKLNPTGTDLVWSTFLDSATGGDQGYAIAVDASGNAYVTGHASVGAETGVNFPTTAGAFESDFTITATTTNGSTTITAAPGTFSPNKDKKVITGPGLPAGGGRIFSVAGDGSSATLNAAAGATAGTGSFVLQAGYISGNNAFVTKLDPNGGLAYSTLLGGGRNLAGGFNDTPGFGTGIAVKDGLVYVTGRTDSATFPTVNPIATKSDDSEDAFVAKLNPTNSGYGTGLLHSTVLGGTGSDRGGGIAVDNSDRIHVVGATESTNFPNTNGYDATLASSFDAFLTKLDPTLSGLSQVIYSTYLGGGGSDGSSEDSNVAIDSLGKTYVAGPTSSTDFPVTTGAFQTAFGGGTGDAFVSKLDTTVSGVASLVYSTYLGGPGNDGTGATGIAVDSSGNAYLGTKSQPGFPTASPIQGTPGGGNSNSTDAAVVKLNPAGTGLVWSTHLGGSGTSGEQASGIGLDPSGNIYFGGHTSSTNFPTTPGAYDTVKDGTQDSFITKITKAAKERLGDFSADGKSDLSVYRNGTWYLLLTNTLDSNTTISQVSWGGDSSDKPVPGDYNGDGHADVAVYRTSTGTWYVKGQFETSWGGDPSDIPVPGDYDGDGDTDLAVYRKATGTWYFQAGATFTQWGGDPSDIPVPGDYNKDGTTDLAVYRASTGYWYVKDQPALEGQWGGDSTDKPVQGDYDGDGDTDMAVYRTSTGYWYVKDQPGLEGQWGGDTSDKAVAGDYNRDGKTDLAVFRKATGVWYVKDQFETSWGGDTADIPLVKNPALLVP